MSTSSAEIAELLTVLKTFGVFRFKNADLEVEFRGSIVYPDVSTPDMPEPTQDGPEVDDGSERKRLLHWST
jgi:hypothetical protein